MAAIFISHSSADKEAASEMKLWLEAQGHTSLFLDFNPEAVIKGGSNWEQTLYRQLRQCQAVIALLTPNWLASKWCFAELVQARERGKRPSFRSRFRPARREVSSATFSTSILQFNPRKATKQSEGSKLE
jgi:hypothetical protein